MGITIKTQSRHMNYTCTFILQMIPRLDWSICLALRDVDSRHGLSKHTGGPAVSWLSAWGPQGRRCHGCCTADSNLTSHSGVTDRSVALFRMGPDAKQSVDTIACCHQQRLPSTQWCAVPPAGSVWQLEAGELQSTGIQRRCRLRKHPAAQVLLGIQWPQPQRRRPSWRIRLPGSPGGAAGSRCCKVRHHAVD